VYALDYTAVLTTDSLASPLERQVDFLLEQEGRLLGVGARIERQAPRWAGSAGVAIASTERRSDDRFGGRWVQAPWAEPRPCHIGTGRSGHRPTRWERPPGSRARTGRLGAFVAFRRAYYDVLPSTPARRFSAASTSAGRPATACHLY
jgi:hypothetical protein